MLEIKSLKKSYGDFSVSVDMHINEGETLVLAGPSGSGKTTALNLIAGLIQPESGKIISDGEDITNLPPWKRNISVVFQDLALFPHLDVGGNIAYGLFIKRIPRKERLKVVEETLKTVRLPGYESRCIDTLSGGEKQRVAIARSLASNPRALLLDEPFSSLDAPLRKDLRREFLEIRSQSKAPCVFVTHDREEAMMLGNRIAFIKDGHIIETGTGRELFLEPKTEASARFFGAGQVMPCRIIEKHGCETEVSSPLGMLTVSHNAENIPASCMLFIPNDAVFYGESSCKAGQKSFNAQFTGSIFEGQKQILKLLLQGDEPTPFEITSGPRTILPVSGSTVTFWVDQSLLRFVEGDNFI